MTRTLATLATIVAAATFAPSAHAGEPVTCSSANKQITTVADTDGYTTKYDVDADGFDPNPLLYTTIEVEEPGCLIAMLSLHSLDGWGFGDDYMAVQVTVDTKPMIGHLSACIDPATGDPMSCVLFAANPDGVTRVDGHTYHFLAEVEPGYHRVQVFFAGAGGGTGAYAGGSVLTLFHP